MFWHDWNSIFYQNTTKDYQAQAKLLFRKLTDHSPARSSIETGPMMFQWVLKMKHFPPMSVDTMYHWSIIIHIHIHIHIPIIPGQWWNYIDAFSHILEQKMTCHCSKKLSSLNNWIMNQCIGQQINLFQMKIHNPVLIKAHLLKKIKYLLLLRRHLKKIWDSNFLKVVG